MKKLLFRASTNILFLVLLGLFIFVILGKGVDAKEKRRIYPKAMVGLADYSKSVVVADFVSYRFFPPGIEKSKENLDSINFPKAYLPVQANYRIVRFLKGPKLDINLPIRQFAVITYSDKKGSVNKPAENWIPKPGTRWILFLKTADPNEVKERGGYVCWFMEEYCGRIPYTNETLMIVLDDIRNSKIKHK